MIRRRISDLRHRVTLGRYVEGKDDRGNPTGKQWQEAAAVWASVEGLRGSHYFAAQQTVDRSDHRIIIRYRKDITQGMIARHDGREFTVNAVLDREGRRRWLELECREVKPT